MRCLMIYHSLTGQTVLAADRVREALQANGWDVDTVTIAMTDPADHMARPLSLADTKKWTAMAEKGAIVPIACTPEEALARKADLVLLFSATWSNFPCVPMQSFLASDGAATVLGGRPFGVFVICRRLWENNLTVMRQLGERAGGRFIGGEAFMNPGSGIGSLIKTVSYLWSDGPGWKHVLGFPLPRYGLSSEALERAPKFALELAALAANQA